MATQEIRFIKIPHPIILLLPLPDNIQFRAKLCFLKTSPKSPYVSRAPTNSFYYVLTEIPHSSL